MQQPINILFLSFAWASIIVSGAPANEVPMPGEGACRKVTGQLDGAYHQYFALPAWNADGSKLLVVRKRDGRKKAWIIDDYENGAFGRPRELPLKAFYFYLQWDAKNPRLLYFTVTNRGARETRLCAFDVERWALANDRAPVLSMRHGAEGEQIPQLYPPHPDGEHILLGPRQKGNGDICIYIRANRSAVFRLIH